MTDNQWIKVICTVGPSSLDPNILKRMDELGVSIFRINLSHTPIEELEKLILDIRRITQVPLCIDTEGAQIRTGRLRGGSTELRRGGALTLTRIDSEGDETKFTLRPPEIFDSLEPGTLLSVDFDAVLLLIIENDGETASAKVLSGGTVGSNKGVACDREPSLPSLTSKDLQAIEIAVKHRIDLFALSFASSGSAVSALRDLVGPDSKVISKVESESALAEIDGIINASDAILIDRGDLSRNISVENLPFLQKQIISRAHQKPLPVYVATNLLESMVTTPYPSRAEVSDIASTLLDGANGLVLAAETAVGNYPVQCVAMLRRLIAQYMSETWRGVDSSIGWRGNGLFSPGVAAHGGRLTDRRPQNRPHDSEIEGLPKLSVDAFAVRDAEQIASGAYSPLAGFMGREAINSVLDRYALPDGTVWTLPISLQVRSQEIRWSNGTDIVLECECCGENVALMKVTDVYDFDLEDFCRRLFGVTDQQHPGVDLIMQRGDLCVGGEITLLKQHTYHRPEICLSPSQSRAIFSHNGWDRVIGIHAFGLAHKAYEYIQTEALERVRADGLFIQPVMGNTESGDFTEEAVLASYEALVGAHSSDSQIVLSGFFRNLWHAGPREVLFSAICAKNFGCSHFAFATDRANVDSFYRPSDFASLFEKVGDIGIEPIIFSEVGFDPRKNHYRELVPGESHSDLQHVSRDILREYLKKAETPPDWMMTPGVSKALLDVSANGGSLFEP